MGRVGERAAVDEMRWKWAPGLFEQSPPLKGASILMTKSLHVEQENAYTELRRERRHRATRRKNKRISVRLCEASV